MTHSLACVKQAPYLLSYGPSPSHRFLTSPTNEEVEALPVRNSKGVSDLTPMPILQINSNKHCKCPQEDLFPPSSQVLLHRGDLASKTLSKQAAVPTYIWPAACIWVTCGPRIFLPYICNTVFERKGRRSIERSCSHKSENTCHMGFAQNMFADHKQQYQLAKQAPVFIETALTNTSGLPTSGSKYRIQVLHGTKNMLGKVARAFIPMDSAEVRPNRGVDSEEALMLYLILFSC